MKILPLTIIALSFNIFCVSAQDIKLSLSRGVSTPVSQTGDSLSFNPQNVTKASVYIALFRKGWDGVVKGREAAMTFGISFGGGLVFEHAPFIANFNAFGIAGETTSRLFVRTDETNKKQGYNLEVSPTLSFQLGDFELSPIVGFGYLKTIQHAYIIEQSIATGTYPAYIKIFNRPEATNSGFMISPKFRVAYSPGPIGLWVEGDYVAGPEMISRTYRLVPAGRPGSDGLYKSDQILAGTATESVHKGNYGSFGVSAGISVSLEKKKKGKPTVGGYDDDCDGLATVTETYTNENGQIVQRVLKTKTKSNQSNDVVTEDEIQRIQDNPLYEGNQQGDNPLYNPQSRAAASCGPVTQRTVKPDGTIEEMTFACPDDAIYFNERKGAITVPKQTQGATFGEKVNQGLHAAGGALSQGASLLGGALPGGAVISAIQVAQGMPNRISMNVTVAKQPQGAMFGERVVLSGTIHVSLVDEGCVVFMPDNTTILINTRKQTATEISESESNSLKDKLKARQALIDSPGADIKGFIPGGSIVSAAVSSVSALAGSGGGAAAASYAATGRIANPGDNKVVAEIPDNDCDGLVQVPDGDYEISFKVVEKATSGLKDTLKTQVRIGFTVQNNVLKTKHDTVKNSINNVR
ncbi:MAG: hypothetical protein QM800_01870 [Paludibacter sp.]